MTRGAGGEKVKKVERRGRCCKVKQVCSELRRKVDEESGMWRW